MGFKFKTGIESIDREILGGGFDPGTLLAIAGHPGAGKTTMASMIAYYNGVEGKRTLYVSFQENKLKLFSHMKILGLDLKSLENEGLFSFIRLPIVAGDEAAEDVVNKISGLVYETKADIVIVDSINPLIEAYSSNVSRRAVIQNFFYTLPEITGGLAVIIVEVPHSNGSVYLEGGVDFVADAVFMLYHYIEENFITRELEIRKLRGHKIAYARLPFFIRNNQGIVVKTPPRLERVPGVNLSEGFKPPCSPIKEYFGGMFRGMVTFTSYPADARIVTPLVFMAATAIYNKAKTLFFSFTLSPEEIRNLIEIQLLERLKFNKEEIKNIINLMNNYVKIYSVNPASYSAGELYSYFINVVEEEKPDILTVIGAHKLVRKLVRISRYSSSTLLDNIILYLKSIKSHTLLLAPVARSTEYSLLAELADAILRYDFIVEDSSIRKRIYAWKKGSEPRLLHYSVSDECCREVGEILRKELQLKTDSKTAIS